MFFILAVERTVSPSKETIVRLLSAGRTGSKRIIDAIPYQENFPNFELLSSEHMRMILNANGASLGVKA